jgi:benzoyl-CoA reductase subunit C
MGGISLITGPGVGKSNARAAETAPPRAEPGPVRRPREREELIARWKGESGGRALGCLCSYVPRELIWAFGILPVRLHGLCGEDGSTTLADTQLPAFICPYVRTTLDRGLRGDYAFLDGLVFTYSCDAACGLFNIWKEVIAGSFFHFLPHAYARSESAAGFAVAALNGLRKALEEYTGRPLDSGRLQASLALYREIGGLVERLYRHRRLMLPGLEGSAFYELLFRGFFLPPDGFRSCLEETIALLPAGRPARRGFPLLLAGTNLTSPALVDQIEAAGAIVVDDDLCSGRRGFLRGGPGGVEAVGISGDRPAAITALLNQISLDYQTRIPCPSRVPPRERFAHLAAVYREANARGVVLAVPKFCDPLLADVPLLQQFCREAGIPLLSLEMEERAAAPGRWKTRIEGFLEVISG